jgi:post-segregation antitoxin (ccd killing protein)
MTAKVSITMSDELYQRLGKVRDKFNISGICQEALDREIKIEELALKGADDEAIIERLKLEKAKRGLSSRQEGRKQGITSAKFFSYVQLMAFVDFHDRFFFKNFDDYGEEFTTVQELIDLIPINGDPEKGKALDCKFVMDLEDLFSELSTSPEVDIRRYFIGFVEGIVSFYESIRDKIGDQKPEEQAN